MHDVLARVALAKLCHTISRARSLDGMCIWGSHGLQLESFVTFSFLTIIQFLYFSFSFLLCESYLSKINSCLCSQMLCTDRPDIRSQFSSVLYQLLLDPNERVCFEAILCVLGKFDNAERYISLFLMFCIFHPFCRISVVFVFVQIVLYANKRISTLVF